MILRKSLLATSVAVAVMAVSSVNAAPFQASNTGPAVQPSFATPNGSTVLYDQTDSAAGNGAPVQNFEASFDAYDSEGADDFVVPAGGWTVSSFNFVTTVGTPVTTTAALNVYADAAGLPGGAPVCSAAAAVADVTATGTTVTLPAPCVLGAGTYWVALTVDVNFGTNGQIFWSNRSVQTNSPGVFRNPGDGFASGCTDWAAMTTCGVGGGASPDFLFQVVGAVGGGGEPFVPGIALPTMSQWSALLAAGGLALLGMFGLRRRARR
ncbi:MAG: hypothetical protein WAS23_07870 [Dokdonella sp.]|uniref:hypothetical protein n=1 Tax=Dokdonella sp. TaxID=2291710 RepID=UPI002B511705|nr:hypothetical protein [Dokdonella sp.]HOX72255.1 hypothetical protein [Dokdonella sp.]HPG95319.1 hypothetical protein [Dokdonella sp.]HPN79858.1 hypothetical protein [Dokdonella sp.]